MTEAKVVDRLLAYNPERKQGYGLYQDFLSAIRTKNTDWFNELLAQDYGHLPEKYTTTIKTFKSYHTGILNVLGQTSS